MHDEPAGLSNELGYPDAVLRRFVELPRAGRLAADDAAVRVADAGTHAGRFRLHLECRIEDDVVSDSRFLAYGCPYTIAVGAWLAQWCLGRSTADLASAPLAALRAELEIPEDRAHCCLLAQDVLRALSPLP